MPSPADTVYTTIGSRICRGRRSVGLTQEQLAAHLNLTRTSIVNIEKGHQRLLVHTLLEICRVINLPPSQMVADILPTTETLEESIPHDLDHETRAWINTAVKGSTQPSS